MLSHELICRNIVCTFGGVRALDDVSLTLKSGQITAIIGPNGAGKTTLFHVLAGALAPMAGLVKYDGKRVSGRAGWRVARLGISRVFQDNRIFRSLSVLDNLLVSFPHQRGEGPDWAIARPVAVRRQTRKLHEDALRLLTAVGLDGVNTAMVAGDLSIGQQKLLAIARTLGFDANVVLLDEPTAGVHSSYITKIAEILDQLIRGGRIVVIIEHDMTFVQRIAHEVHFLDRGRLLASGAPGELLSDARIRRAYLGLER